MGAVEYKQKNLKQWGPLSINKRTWNNRRSTVAGAGRIQKLGWVCVEGGRGLNIFQNGYTYIKLFFKLIKTVGTL